MARLPKIIDNKRVSLLNAIKNISSDFDTLSIATGYWNLAGTDLVIDNLRKYKKIRLLIGREPLIPRHQLTSPETDYPDQDFKYDLASMPPSGKLKNTITCLKKLIDQKVLEVKVYRKTFLHAKCYIFGDYSCKEGIGIIGSSNFTESGLTHNTELNALESDHRIVYFQPKSKDQEAGHLFWFDELWNDPTTEDWDGKFSEILELSPVGDTLYSPYETYIKTLYELYKEELEEEELDTSLKGAHDLMSFQIKNVHALIRRLRKYKVAMLADSVGLGKTYTAIEVIKQYLTGDGVQKRIEVICPKSLKNQWTKELTTQGVLNITPLTLQNQKEIESRIALDKIAGVSLFVLDESHNLRNKAGKRFDQIVNWIRTNKNCHVLLLTATPINNQINDLSNQILLGTGGEADVFRVTAVDNKLKHTAPLDFYTAIQNLKKKMNQDYSEKGEIDFDYVRQIMAPIIRAFVVRRTRQGIIKEYGCLRIDGKESGFPVPYPEVKKYRFKEEVLKEIQGLKSKEIDLKTIYCLQTGDIIDNTKDLLHPLRQLRSIKCMEKEKTDESPISYVYKTLLMLGFIHYKWRMYQTKYYGKTREQIKALNLPGEERMDLYRQISLYGILRTSLLKRLESSVSALRYSLDNYGEKLEIFEKGLNKNIIVSMDDPDAISQLLEISDDEADAEDQDQIKELELDKVDDKRYALKELKQDIEKEKQLLKVLDQQLAIIEKDDSKIKAFADLLNEINKKNTNGGKVLVFSFFADTVEYLKRELPKHTPFIKGKEGFLSSRNRVDADILSGSFAPKAQKYELKGKPEIKWLFSTDILSEGQNLQDCGILINYDLHWNPVRMIQRNGRINRIGSEFKNVYIYNISPEQQLEEHLRLVERLEGKINLIKNTIGTDTPVLDEKENPIEFTDTWKDIYSDDQAKRMKAFEEAEKESDLLLAEDDYVSDLKIFHEDENIPEAYKKDIYCISEGKWAVMPECEHHGEKRGDVLILSRLDSEKEKGIGYAFYATTKDGDDFKAVPQLQALEWLKTNKDDNKRVADKISISKVEVSEIVRQKSQSYTVSEAAGSPIGQQNKVLELMYNLHFEMEDIKLARISFQTKNVLDSQKIKKLTREIVKRAKENKDILELIKELVKISKNKGASSNITAKVVESREMLYYVRDNK
ncbi:MAG: hypothetical protein A2452_08360 [Candidatus Firestonebacteria bacterium RIFOXYC2_FULL_39_67]|nr:MAG: hypothetical protein A2536_05345 [Candidatus Firestonebacteria bacterium RIFOXYD2_FULL_39_29]OGF56933.1 MAG: hypothetical protein A2452_08360 [Candidatus Firestonebacteria bacterium RIFOXYC2_FULL_39_67]